MQMLDGEHGEPDPAARDSLTSDNLSASGSAVEWLCEEFLERSSDLGATGVSVSRCIDGSIAGLLYSSDELATKLEELQVTLAESPARTALRTGGPVLVSDFGDEPPSLWMAFSGEVQRLGICSVYAVPIQVGAITLGIVNVYGAGRLRSSEALPTQVFWLADLISSSLLMPHGMDSRSVRWAERFVGEAQMITHQAAGMVMVQARGTLQDAMVILRASAFSSGVSLNEIARQVVSRERSFVNQDPGFGSPDAELDEGSRDNG